MVNEFSNANSMEISYEMRTIENRISNDDIQSPFVQFSKVTTKKEIKKTPTRTSFDQCVDTLPLYMFLSYDFNRLLIAKHNSNSQFGMENGFRCFFFSIKFRVWLF